MLGTWGFSSWEGPNPQLCGAVPCGWEGSGQRCTLWSCVGPVPSGEQAVVQGPQGEITQGLGQPRPEGHFPGGAQQWLEPGLTPCVLRSTMCGRQSLEGLVGRARWADSQVAVRVSWV